MPRLTLGFLKEQTLARLEDNNELFQDDELTDAINEAISVANLLCGWFQGTYPVSTSVTVAGRHIYDTPKEIIFPMRVTFENQVLEPSPMPSMMNDWPDFLKDTTATLGMQVSRWVPLGITKFAIHPADSVGGGSLLVTGISEPDVLVEDSDLIYIPKEAVTTVCDYAAHIVQCKLQGVPFSQSLAMFGNFQTLVNLYKYWNSYKQPTMYLDQQKPTRE
jgi:hypothetical protein